MNNRNNQSNLKSIFSPPRPYKPSVILFPNRNILYISYGCNGIFVYLTEPTPSGYVPQFVDVTDAPPHGMNDGDLIRNSYRNNRTAASYNSETRQINVKHRKRIYSLQLPTTVKSICCGENALYFRDVS